jgi:predicted nucleotidyltransferase component of viral defense system
MINDVEIVEKAEEFQINTADLQRDYIFGWLLNGIYTQSQLSNSLILKGGNALRKGYLRNTRFSKDLDFSVVDTISPYILKQELDDICAYTQDKTGVDFEVDKTRVLEKIVFDRQQKQVFEARLYFNSFYGEEEVILKVQLDISI